MPKRKTSLTGNPARKKQTIAKRICRENETIEEEAVRLQAMAEKDNIRRAAETVEEARFRKSRMALRNKFRREGETDVEADARKSIMAQRDKIRREGETDEEADARRSIMAQRDKIRREGETDEEADARRSIMAYRDKVRRERETGDEAGDRRRRMAERANTRRAQESNDEAVRRREALRAASKANRREESLQAREERLSENAIRRRNFSAEKEGRGSATANLTEHKCGAMTHECPICSGLHFFGEKTSRGTFSKCCHSGKVNLPDISYPSELKQLMNGTDDLSNHFHRNIRSYNSALSFASLGAQVEAPAGSGPYCYRIHGAIYHRTGHLHPKEPGQEKFAQLYILDSEQALEQRMKFPENNSCLPELMHKLDEIIRRVNPYASAFKMLHQMEEEVIQEAGLREAKNVRMYITEGRPASNISRGRHNAPKGNEVAIVFRSEDGVPPTNRDICIYPKHEKLCRINTLNPNCEPMTYVLFFPCGESGFKITDSFSELQYYSQRLTAKKEKFNPILHGGKLLHQYIVDAYVKVEGNRLAFIRRNQRTLRVDSYMGLADHVNVLASEAGLKPGVPVILPSTFGGSPRAMHQNFQDAMAIVRDFGKPDLFITFTCNPKWSDISQSLLAGQKPQDRPDLVARVFDVKKKALLDDLKRHGVLGRTVADIHVIEFQKRGLPHMHLLLILGEEDKVRDPQTIDAIVCAELPDATSDPRLLEIVTSTMIHGPCGAMNPTSPCMVDGVCSKNYPKQFREETAENIDGYPMYRRRDDGQFVSIKGFAADNRWVVPYNPYLAKKYNAHINVELCSSVKSIKYIFKYVYKGYDCAKVVFDQSEGSVSWDEVQTYLNARYVSAPEGAWRILEKPMHEKSHAIIRLPVHEENMQPVYFFDSEERLAFEAASHKRTMLTGWFDLNVKDKEANQYLYADIPKHFVWKNNSWERRARSGHNIISRMYSVSPRDIERFHLRLLLCHVPGARSYDDLKTYEMIQHNTFKEACRARNLLQNNDEWRKCLMEATQFQMPAQLRQLFSFICAFCEPASPEELFEEFRNDLSEDFAHRLPGEESVNQCLHCISDHLRVHNITLKDLKLPSPQTCIREVTSPFNLEHERSEGNRMAALLNPDQKMTFEAVMAAVQDRDDASVKAFCVNAFAGSGKTFLFNTLIHTVRGMGHSVVPTAWTGIAAAILDGGRTVHSSFKLPVPLTENSSCHIGQKSQEGQFLKKAKMIVWDECTMTPHFALEAVDRCLQDITGLPTPFGGKIIILGGDWRQILPVAVHANRVVIIESCLKNSPLWQHFKQFTLTTNMRTGQEESAFSSWLLRLGDGLLRSGCGLPEPLVEVPSECVTQNALAVEIFGKGDPQNLKDKAILCPKNETALKINDEILKKFPGQTRTFYSADTFTCDDEEAQQSFQMDFINGLTPSGMPPHSLNLKEGAIVMLLRNLNASEGLCNGTRLIVKRMMDNVIDAEVVTGHREGTRVFIPRIALSPSDTNLPFQLQRRQFPLRLAFAMTINKAQGQSLKKVGIHLEQPVFSHGMLYVAFSRATTMDGVRVRVKNAPNQGKLLRGSDKVFTQNIVFPEVLK